MILSDLEREVKIADPRGWQASPAWLYFCTLSPGSLKGQMTGILTALSIYEFDKKLGDLSDAEKEDLRKWMWSYRWWEMDFKRLRDALADYYRPSNANKALSLAKSLLKMSHGKPKRAHAETVMRAIGIRGVRNASPRKGRYAPGNDIRAMLAICDDGTPQGIRDVTILLLLHSCAPATEEMAGMSYGDLKYGTGKMTFHGTGKRKPREVELPANVMDAFIKWRRERGRSNGPMWQGFRKDGAKQNGDGWSSWSINERLKVLVERAGVRPVTIKDFEQSLGADLIDNQELQRAMEILGHRSPLTTWKLRRSFPGNAKSPVLGRELEQI